MEKLELHVSEEETLLPLASNLDIRCSAPLKASFDEIISLGKPLVIDASKVERMSTPCIQVILSAAKALEEENIEFSLLQPSDAFVDAFDDLGLFGILIKWKVAS